jgi:hypothetical protein
LCDAGLPCEHQQDRKNPIHECVVDIPQRKAIKEEENSNVSGESGGLPLNGSPPRSVPVEFFRTIHPVIAPLIAYHLRR